MAVSAHENGDNDRNGDCEQQQDEKAAQKQIQHPAAVDILLIGQAKKLVRFPAKKFRASFKAVDESPEISRCLKKFLKEFGGRSGKAGHKIAAEGERNGQDKIIKNSENP